MLGFKVASRQEVDAVHGRLVDSGCEGEQPPYDAPWDARSSGPPS